MLFRVRPTKLRERILLIAVLVFFHLCPESTYGTETRGTHCQANCNGLGFDRSARTVRSGVVLCVGTGPRTDEDGDGAREWIR